MKNHGLGTLNQSSLNDKMCAEISPNMYPTIYSAHLAKLGQLFGIFLKKILIKYKSIVHGWYKSQLISEHLVGQKRSLEIYWTLMIYYNFIHEFNFRNVQFVNDIINEFSKALGQSLIRYKMIYSIGKAWAI